MSSSSIADKHAGHNSMQRNASSLSTESAEFEFDSCSFPELISDEPPLSPKLLYSPNYSPHYSERLLMASSNQFSAESASKAEYVEQPGFDDHLPYEAPVLRINHDSANAGEEKKRVNVRSLLNRRDLKQLPPLTNYNIKSNLQISKDIKKQVPVQRSSPASTSSTSSASPSSSPRHYHANQSSNPCISEDNQGDASSAPESKSSQKKSRKWPFKLDFLRKGPSTRAHQALNQSSNDDSLNHSKISSQPDHCSIAAPAEEAGLDESLHERDNTAATAGEVSDYQLNDRIGRYRTAAAAGEARFNRQINQSIDNYRVGAAAVITKFESPRQSTSSVISSVSSSPRRGDNEMIRANRISPAGSPRRSLHAGEGAFTRAPISPAGSPPRSLHAGEGAFTRARSPMSPHALHYQQQRARNEELRKKTFLPYRQSLLSACFFPPSTPPPHHPPQAVY